MERNSPVLVPLPSRKGATIQQTSDQRRGPRIGQERGVVERDHPALVGIHEGSGPRLRKTVDGTQDGRVGVGADHSDPQRGVPHVVLHLNRFLPRLQEGAHHVPSGGGGGGSISIVASDDGSVAERRIRNQALVVISVEIDRRVQREVAVRVAFPNRFRPRLPNVPDDVTC